MMLTKSDRFYLALAITVVATDIALFVAVGERVHVYGWAWIWMPFMDPSDVVLTPKLAAFGGALIR